MAMRTISIGVAAVVAVATATHDNIGSDIHWYQHTHNEPNECEQNITFQSAPIESSYFIILSTLIDTLFIFYIFFKLKIATKNAQFPLKSVHCIENGKILFIQQ